ncbi:NUDIX hydrolase [Pseudomonas sp. HK3]
MKYLILSVFLVAVISCSSNDITAAGVVAYAEHDGVHYVLLADHTGLASYRGYAAFGGGLEANETLEQGALREFHEETGCYFLGQIQSISKEYVRNDHYVSFVVRIPFIPSDNLNQPSQSNGCDGDVYSERENWIWVEKAALLQQLEKGDHFKNDVVDISLWDKSTVIIKQAQSQGLLP